MTSASSASAVAGAKPQPGSTSGASDSFNRAITQTQGGKPPVSTPPTQAPKAPSPSPKSGSAGRKDAPEHSSSTRSAPPSAKAEKAADVAGAKAVADYRQAATTTEGRDRIATGLTGHHLSQMDAGQRRKVESFLDRIKAGDTPKLDFTAAAQGSKADVTKGNPALGPDILQSGVDGAYVATGNKILFSDRLGSDALARTATHEVGHALASAAAAAGIKTAPAGDVGNRMELAMAGTDVAQSKRPDLYRSSTADSTTVLVDGHTAEASAKAAKPKFNLESYMKRGSENPLNNDANGSLANWELKTVLEKSGAKIDMQSANRLLLNNDVNHDGVVNAAEMRQMQRIGALSKDGTSYDLKRVNPDAFLNTGDKNGSLAAGELFQALKDRDSTTTDQETLELMDRNDADKNGVINRKELSHMYASGDLRFGPVGNAQLFSTGTSAAIAVDDGGYVRITEAGKPAYYLVSGADTKVYDQLVKKGDGKVYRDYDGEAGQVTARMTKKSSGAIQVRYPYAPNSPEFDMRYRNAGTQDFSVTETQKFDNRAVGRRGVAANSIVQDAHTIIPAGKDAIDDATTRLGDHYTAWKANTFSSSLSGITVTVGGNSKEQGAALERDLGKAVNVISQAAEDSRLILSDLADIAQRGGTFKDMAAKLSDTPVEKMSEDDARKIVTGLFKEQAATFKSWLSENTTNIRDAIKNYQSTKAAEDKKASMDRILALVDVIGGVGSALGTAASAAASIASVVVRTTVRNGRAAAVSAKEGAVEAAGKHLNDIWDSADGPTLLEAQKKYSSAISSLNESKANWKGAADLVLIGKAQLGGWVSALSGTGMAAVSRGLKYNVLNASTSDINGLAAAISNGMAGLPNPIVDTSVQQDLTDMSITTSSEWKEFGRALYDGMAFSSGVNKSGVLQRADDKPEGYSGPTVKIPNVNSDGDYLDTRDMVRTAYHDAFENWKQTHAKDGYIYYFDGNARLDSDGFYVDPNIYVYGVEAPFMKYFPGVS